MARKPRVDYAGAWHHVTHRGARRAPIFLADDHCLLFLECLEEAAVRHRCEVHAYALMPNHYHLLLRSVTGALSRAMQHLNGRYTQRLNQRHGWDGPVFRGRFYNEVIKDDDHLRAVAAFIHLNPVRAGLATRPELAHWSSYPAYVGEAGVPPWLRRDQIVALFESLETMVQRTADLHRGAERWPNHLDLETGHLVGWAPAPGDSTRHAEQPPTRPTADQVLDAVAKTTGLPRDSVESRRMGRSGNPARRFAVWALSTVAGLSHREIGQELGMSTAHVSATIARVGRACGEEPLATWTAELLGPWADHRTSP